MSLQVTIHLEQKIDRISDEYNMNRRIFLIFIFLLLFSKAFSGAFENGKLKKVDKVNGQQQRQTYFLDTGRINILLSVEICSRSIIRYKLEINSASKSVTQSGFALNLTSEQESPYEPEEDERGKTVWVIPYLTYLCGCSSESDLEIRIEKNYEKVSLYSSRKTKSELFGEKLTSDEDPNESIRLANYLHVKNQEE